MISTNASRVTVRVIRTDEELMIARSVLRACPGDTFTKTTLQYSITHISFRQ